MNDMSGALTCLECGQPIPGNRSLVCSARCGAVINLVQYGRTARRGGLDWPDQDRLNRLRRQAEVSGHFPTWRVWNQLRERDGECCRYPGCGRRDARMIDWESAEPVLTRVVRRDDLRTICSEHQASEAVQRQFVGPSGHVVRTAPAIWARIEAASPLVRRDDGTLWASTENWSLLTTSPLTSETTRRDLQDWIDALGQPSSESKRQAHGVAVTSEDHFEAAFNAALDRLTLPRRRREHLVRAINALILRVQADEAIREALLRQEPVRGDTDQSFPLGAGRTNVLMDGHVPDPDQDRRARLNQRLRQAFVAGAEQDSRRRLGRGLTAEEMERVLRHYPGDVAERREQ